MSVVVETTMARTPLPLPAHFAQAEQSFSLKKRRLPFSSSSTSNSTLSPPGHPLNSLPPRPRPRSRGCLSVSRLFPEPPTPWTPLSCSLIKSPPSAPLYDPVKQQSFFSQCFTNLGLLGRGSFGEVYKVLSHQDGCHYAVKRSAHRFRGPSERNRCIREARNHERLCPHPHILGFVAAWEECSRLYIQMELCCTSLLMHAENQPPTSDEPSAWNYLCDLLSALHHLHCRGFAHLDLKPANVFLTHSGRLKLGDFGLLLEMPEQGSRAAVGEEKEDFQEGDPRYMAPELLRGEYGPAADVFSLGVTILELACNMEVPKGGEGWQQLRRGILPSEITNVLSSELQTVLRMMLAPEPSQRATVAELLSLPSVRGHRWRRRISLLLQEAVLLVVSLCQSVLSCGWKVLSFLNLPFLPHWSTPLPCTPSKDNWEADFTLPLSVMHTDSSGAEDDGVFLSNATPLDVSPTFSHRVRSRMSAGSTSTPLPVPPLHLSPAHTPPRSVHTPSRSLPPTPSSIHSDRSQGTPTCHLTFSVTESHAHSLVSCSTDSALPASSNSSRRRARNRGRAEETALRPGFEPKNLLSLFDDTALEGGHP